MADDAIDSGEGLGQELELDPAPTPRRRRALWAALAVIAVAAGAVVVNTTDDDAPSKLPVALGSAAGERSGASSTMAADMSMLAWVTYVAGDDLPVLGGDGPAYKLDGSVSEDEVRRLADALGLEGDITHDQGSWRLETDHGMVEVYEGFAGSWWYSSTTYSGGADGSVSSSPVTTIPPDVATSDCPPDAKCVDRVPEPITPPADLPSEGEARQIALDLIAATGLDVTDAKVTVDGPFDAWYIAVEPRIGGQIVSGLSATVSVGSKGAVTNASGYLADPESLGDYPVVDTRAAIDRLNAQMSGYGAASGREATAGDAESETLTTAVADDPIAPEDSTTTITLAPDPAGPTDPAPPECLVSEAPAIASDDPTGAGAAGSSGSEPVTTTVSFPTDAGGTTACPPSEPYVPPEPVEIVLHEAEPVLVLMPAVDESGDAYLVPGYRFHGDDDTTVDAVAVDDDSLAPPPQVPTEPDHPVTTSVCAPVEPGPDGAVPDICLAPEEIPPAGRVEGEPSTTVEEPQP